MGAPGAVGWRRLTLPGSPPPPPQCGMARFPNESILLIVYANFVISVRKDAQAGRTQLQLAQKGNPGGWVRWWAGRRLGECVGALCTWVSRPAAASSQSAPMPATSPAHLCDKHPLLMFSAWATGFVERYFIFVAQELAKRIKTEGDGLDLMVRAPHWGQGAQCQLSGWRDCGPAWDMLLACRPGTRMPPSKKASALPTALSSPHPLPQGFVEFNRNYR